MHPRPINSSPLFEKPDGWSSGFTLAAGHGPGVVVGPGSTNPNVFAQPFQVKQGDQFQVVARASSVDRAEGKAAVQINWHGEKGKFISSAQQFFDVGRSESAFHYTTVAPAGATQGVVYVVPGGKDDVIRYTEMTVSRLEPFHDFMSYRFFGLKGESLLSGAAVFFLLLALYSRYRRAISKLFEYLSLRILRVFPAVALALCGIAFVFLETDYEQHIDSHWHQAQADTIMTWNDFSLDLRANPLYNFGIQFPINPQLSPTFWLGSLVPPDHRIQVEAAFQAIVLFVLLVHLCRLAGAGLRDASAIGLIATYYLCVPYMSGGLIPSNAVLGLLWQEAAIATLLTFLFFSRMGLQEHRLARAGCALALAGTIIWMFMAYSELTAFYVLATAGLCVGALIASETKKELLYKTGAAGLIVLGLLLLGLHRYILDLFLYTPQLYYDTLRSSDAFPFYFFTATTLFIRYFKTPDIGLYAFYLLALAGTFFSLWLGNAFARRIVFGAVALEAVLVSLSLLNWMVGLVPMNFFYAEMMGLSVVSLLAATAVWAIMRYVLLQVSKALKLADGYFWGRDPEMPAMSRSEPAALPCATLIGAAAFVLYQSAGQTHFSVWPPRNDSKPAQLQVEAVGIKPGDKFQGRSLSLVGMGADGASNWTRFVDIVASRYRLGLGTDLTIDAMAHGVPVINEYGHWTSPLMVAMLAAGFYLPQDHIGRAAQAPRYFRPNLARLMGVSVVISDKPLPGEMRLLHDVVEGHDLYIHRIEDANLGQYSPVRTLLAKGAGEMLDLLRAPEFDGRLVAIVENPLDLSLVGAEKVNVRLVKGPRIEVAAKSTGRSLLVLPFDFSHCLEISGNGVERIIPVNLGQTGVVISGNATFDISYRYGLIKGTSCRSKDLARIRLLQLDRAATGRLFYDSNAMKTPGAEKPEQVSGAVKR